MRLVQLKKGNERRVAIVEEPRLRLLDGVASVYELANFAIKAGDDLSQAAASRTSSDSLDYDAVYSGKSEWKLMVPFDHPEEPARCIISGTGLTHLGSAQGRDSMHSAATAAQANSNEPVTDSMKMFRWGIAEGRPEVGTIGIAPEWFYKGNGSSLRAHGEPLEIPPYAEDGGEEAEVAGIYLVDGDGKPRRVGFAVGNEFSDHQFEKKNYLNLAGSKLRTCSLGPELVIDPQFTEVPVDVADRARRESDLGKIVSQRREGDVPQRAKHRASSLQIRGPPPPKRCPHPLLRHCRAEFRRWREIAGRRRDAGPRRGFRSRACAIRFAWRTPRKV